MYGKPTLSLVFVLLIVLLLISYSILMGTVDFRSYFFPMLQPPATAHPLCATNPPLGVYMYDLPRRFNVGMLNLRNLEQTPVTDRNWPPWPKNSGLKRQHSVEYWMMGSLLYEGDGAEERDAVRVSDPEMADIFFVPFFSSLSFNTHGHVMTDPETEIDHQLQIDLLKFLRQSKYWQQSGGGDHVIPMTHPNAFRFLREQVNASIQIVVDFGRHPRTMSNISKDVVAPYVHIVDSFTDDDSTDPFESRTTLLFFHGRTFRKDEGIVRVKLVKILAAYDDVHYERSVATDENIKVVCSTSLLRKECVCQSSVCILQEIRLLPVACLMPL
ncbi:probable arabinosyltransferase ARAD1 isoform X3 [Juglans microcarpa x Juglans regia]|uniref:probable arabinosyltransferase ARAD1 isoform X3 n=1 Tax=Juglans microcarpa x Juglans regia TaxID=2249226 RepID=UPI001B7E123B|nr:probable arabinosyltransferase ARAD1 isoform X3 [Juglans microcarpa x Juglans regia]